MPPASRVRSSLRLAAMMVAVALTPRVSAWDSTAGNPKHSTHDYITEWGLDQLRESFPELWRFRQAVIDGANAEVHELPVRAFERRMGREYGVDMEAKRVQHRGTNEGCDDAQGWWDDSLNAYRQGQKARAYFLLGVLLHMIEDMGVPAHANHVVHQGKLKEFDSFEQLAFFNWKPKFDEMNRADPGFDDPWRYYGFSQEWTQADAPGYLRRDTYPKFWHLAKPPERALLQNRQGRTCCVTRWAMNSACRAFSR